MACVLNLESCNLNLAQEAAVRCGAGPFLVLAGPGTGKTTTLTARFAHLVAAGVEPRRILALTFTRKSGQELSQRLAQHYGLRPGTVEVSTFHSFAGKLLRPYAAEVGLTSQFRILDEGGQRRLLMGLKVFWNAEKGRELTEIIAAAKAQMRDAAAFRKHVEAQMRLGKIRDSDPLVDAVDPYHDYERALIQANCCDFEDLICHSVRLLERNSEIRAEVASAFDHILVDEFQDVNQGQFRLLRALLQRHRNLWCVGDDDQSIYGFRGADASYSTAFSQHFPDAGLFRLTHNYRSTRQILELAQALIGHNTKRYSKNLNATTGEGPPVVIQAHPEAREEAAWIAAAVGKVIARGVAPKQIAVLFRTGTQASAVQLELRQLGLPCTVHGTGDFWQMAPARGLRGLLRLAHDGRDRLARELIGPKHLSSYLAKAQTFGSLRFEKQLKKAYSFMVGHAPLSFGLSQLEDWEQRTALALEMAGQFEDIMALEAWVESQGQRGRGAEEGVALSTIHAAKGLEWHTVFIAGFENNLLPHNLSDDEEEERRLAYVAMTRARRYLCLSYCERRHQKETGPSEFLRQTRSTADPALYQVR